MKQRTFSINKSEVKVIDDLLPNNEIKEFFNFSRGLSYQRMENDDDDDEYPIFSVDFEPEAFLEKTLIGDIALKLIREKSNKKYVLNRAYINLSSYGDVEFPHYDCDLDKEDITILYYINKEWNYKWGGETLFYEGNDTKYAILPKPGRFVIFQGNVEHCGTVATKICKEPRLTLALKFTTNEK
jgi:Rps23 Pro-64 3,4-dihydroxylase Tpa1-like proline 4-hydroxylase